MSEPFGPFRQDCDPVERIAQLRVLRTLVHVYARNSYEGVGAQAALLRAEHRGGNEALTAMRFFDDLPALTKRSILSTFAFIHRPLYSSARTQPNKGTAHAYVE